MISIDYTHIQELAGKLKKAGADLKNCVLVWNNDTWYLMDRKDFENAQRNNLY